MDSTTSPLSRLRRWAAAIRSTRGAELACVGFLAALIYLPMLGSSNLWDPWETHYAEVARRMIEDGDYVHTRWENESFRSKPVLTFWLMAASMKAFGVAEGGGFSGEMVTSHAAEWALRLPFALAGIAGIMWLWLMLARLASRRAAWIAALVLGTSPYYFFISRQAITDMPACATLIGGLACLALAFFTPDGALKKWRGRFTAYHLFLLVFVLVSAPQVLGFLFYVDGKGIFLSPTTTLPAPPFMAGLLLLFVGVVVWSWKTTKTTRQVYMYWFYLLMAVGVLAKGLMTPGVAGLAVLSYFVVSGEWRRLREVELVRGLLIGLVVCVPWHLAMYASDGRGWAREYIGQHLLGRVFVGAHGDRGTFSYYFDQLGVGMWPWIVLLPAALAHIAFRPRGHTPRDKLASLATCWAITGFTFFAMLNTKFHHYLLPVVPALAIVIALWLDDLIAQKTACTRWAVGLALLLLVPVSIDLVASQQRLVHLFVYKYTRPWPGGGPWNIDYAAHLALFAALFGIALFALARLRAKAVATLAAIMVTFTLFAVDDLMVAAAPHWGQRRLEEIYYRKRQIHGVDLVYGGWREFIRDWERAGDLEVRSLVPDGLSVRDGMRVSYIVPNAKRGELLGHVARIDRPAHRFWIHVPDRDTLQPLLQTAHQQQGRAQKRWLHVNADRLIAWKLNWHGENFYTAGEIYNHQIEDARTVFKSLSDVAFRGYLDSPKRRGKGRKFFIVTEKGSLRKLPQALPNEATRKTLIVEDDDVSNKFSLGSFVLK